MSRSVVLALSVASITATVVVAVALVRAAPEPVLAAAEARARAVVEMTPPARGVAARLAAGGVTVERTLPALTFRLEPDESLDHRLPGGAFEGRFTVTFTSGRTRHAQLGAWISGGSVIVSMGGEQLVVEAAGAEPVLALSREAVFLGSRLQEVTFDFTADGDAPSSLRAMWKPEGATIALPLPTAGAPLIDDPALRGFELARRLHCAECHQSTDPALQERLTSAPAPDLRAVGTRARADWIFLWLCGPRELKHDAAMPMMFPPDDHDRARRIEDLLHFLVSRTGSVPETDAVDAGGLEATGALLYHQVGCFACHGALDGEEPPSPAYAGLGDVGSKMTLDGLAAFLMDPLASRPSGQMPAMNLDEQEARSIAAYLLARDDAGTPAEKAAFEVDPARAARGAEVYTSVGCAACHALPGGDEPMRSTRTARSFESLLGADWQAGCMAVEPVGLAPYFGVTDSERDALRACADSIHETRNPRAPLDDLAAEITRLRCMACHVYHGEGGPAPDVASQFRTLGDADLGDEGRLPPKLGDAGAKLNPAWLRMILEESGQARPYLGVRMPQYGDEAAAGLPELFCAAAGVVRAADGGPSFDTAAAEAGRDLVGSEAMNCIQCHTIAGRDSTGTPGPDLARMVERLRFDAFARWLHDPARVRPGTRMPSFFIGGRSAFTDHYDGAVDEQVRAIWSYLSQGELLPLPEGLIEPGGLNIDVIEEPVVFRTFMTEAGVRAIACGFPEQVHCAFDADAGRLAMIWQGPFLSAKGAWAARGGSETDPEKVVWTAPEAPLFASADAAPLETRFRGYRLDAARRPVFLYQLESSAVRLEVAEQPVPVRRGLETALVRRIEITGPPRAGLRVVHGEQRLTPGEGSFASREAGVTSVTMSDGGRATFELEVTW